MNTKSVERGELKFLAGGGELGALIRDFNWESTPLGPIELWPQSLKTSVSLMLNSQHAVWIGWGPEVTFLYNDAYIRVLGAAKHPWALGRPTEEVWVEIWDVCGPLVDKVFAKGEASYMSDIRFFMNRGDFMEETFYSFSYTPIRDESGSVGGLFCPSTEVTANVLGARRLKILSDLSAKSLVEKTTAAACASAAATLAKNADDVPFALFYLIDAEGKAARLEQAVGLAKGQALISPERLDLRAAKPVPGLWPIQDAVRTGRLQVVPLTGLEGFPVVAAGQRVSEAVVLPIALQGDEHPLGVLVAGVNPSRKLDPDYLTFYTWIAGHVANAIQNARGAEADRKRADMLAELDQAKTTFFSNVSHELRTPLTLILGPLEDEMRASAVPRERLELIHRNSLRLLKLVNTLLDFSRIEAGRVEASFEPLDLSAVTAELASVFRAGVERANLRLIVDCPSLSEPVYVDREMWEKIVFNLLSNALKFTAEGEIEVKLGEVGPGDGAIANGGGSSLPPAGRRVYLSVRDSGIGIPAGELPRIFERFHRVKNSWARSHEGTGIGLALVQELARLHGGVVSAESTEGLGTTFIVSMPMGLAHLPRERVGAARSLASTTFGAEPYVEEAMRWVPRETAFAEPPDGDQGPSGPDADPSRARILLADDNQDMRGYIQRLLEGNDYEVIPVADGVAALEAARAKTPSLILSDVMMPRLDGFGLMRALRENATTKGVPMILLSARAGQEARVDGVEAGANDYLTKPFNARELLARVASHLELARVRKEAADALHEATAKFRALFDQSSIFAGIMALDGTVLEANHLFLDSCGYRAEEVLGKPFWECGWWRGSKDIQDKIQRGNAQAAVGIPYLEALPYHWADGTKRVVDLALHPIRNDRGEVTFIYPTGVDVTDRLRAQARVDFLGRLTQKLSAVSDQAEINRIATREIGLFMGVHRCYFFQALPEAGRVRVLPEWNPENEQGLAGDYLLADFGSPEWAAALQHGPLGVEDVAAHPWTKDFIPRYEALNLRAYTCVPFLHEGRWVASICVSSDRPRRWLDDEKALLEGVVARVWPLMERTRIEGELRISDDALREANTLLADKAAHLEVVVQQRTAKLRETIGELEAFSYSIAHDMRAPLRSLQGFSEILLTDYESSLDADGQRFLRRIATSAGRMDKLIQDVLNYSRVVRGELPLEVVDVDQLLRGIADTYPMFTPEKVDIVFEGPFPKVLGNEAMIMQIFSNIMGNGVKFVAGGIKPHLRIWAEQDLTQVRLSVEDNGIGIAADQQEKIFGIFQQVNRSFEGTGIGLAIVKKAVERMGGRVGLRSEPDRGSTFWVELQLA